MNPKHDLTYCPTCGKNDWKPIPDSLAEHCDCGYVRVGWCGSYDTGATIQQWVSDTYGSKNNKTN